MDLNHFLRRYLDAANKLKIDGRIGIGIGNVDKECENINEDQKKNTNLQQFSGNIVICNHLNINSYMMCVCVLLPVSISHKM